MKIISWNVNGIRAVAKKGFREWVEDYNPDILCVQETKAQPEQVPEDVSDISGYHSFFHSAERKGYSGVGLWTRERPESYGTGLGIGEFDSEGRVQRADFTDFTLFNVYFPNGQSSSQRLDYKMRFYHAFQGAIDELRGQGKKIIVCGDVNTAHKEIDLSRPKENSSVSGFLPEERQWIDSFLDSGFIDSFRMFDPSPGKYSWWSYKTRARERNVGWRIDYFFVDRALENRLEDGFILDEVYGSDHCPVGISLGF